MLASDGSRIFALAGSRVVTDTERRWILEEEQLSASAAAEGVRSFVFGVPVALLTLVLAGAIVPLLTSLSGL